MGSTLPATILVIEEDSAVQELIDQTLREGGHRVLTTKNALEALEVVRRVRIDLLVVGIVLEDRALIRKLRLIQAGLRIVSLNGADDDLNGVECSARLSNPFSLDDLREAAAAALDSREDR